MKLKVTINGVAYDVDVEVEEETPTLGVFHAGSFGSGAATPAPSMPAPQPGGGPKVGNKAIQAPLAGTVASVQVELGQMCKAGETLLVLEAMKMETAITAPSDGEIAAINVSKGDVVSGGQVLVELI